MTDIVIQAPDEATMRKAFAAIGLANEAETGEKINSWDGGTPTKGGSYSILYIGQMQDKAKPTGEIADPMGNKQPTYGFLPGVYSYVRWNTGDAETSYWDKVELLGLSTYWRSDNTDGPDGTPAPLPEWFPRIG